jgi:hypothetical protein
MPYFPATVEGVDNGKPPILALLRYLEQLSVVSSVGGRPQLLNILYGYFGQKEEIRTIADVLEGDVLILCFLDSQMIWP